MTWKSDPTEDAAIVARYLALEPMILFRAAKALGIDRRRLRSILARTGTPETQYTAPEPVEVEERSPDPLPAGHPTTWGLICNEPWRVWA